MSGQTAKSITTVVQDLRKLPSFPQVALDLFDRIQSPTSTLQEISALLSTDPALTAKVLRLANSGYYSIPGGVKDVKRALEFLGFNTISQIVLTSSVPQLFKSTGTPGLPIYNFWKKSLGVAVASELMARHYGVAHPAEAFTCGLLFHVGKLVCLELFPMNFDQIQSEAKKQEFNFDEAAAQQRFYTTTDLGVEISKQWNLPASVSACISATPAVTDKKGISALVHAANRYVTFSKIGDSGDYRAVAPETIGNEWNNEKVTSEFQEQLDRAGAFLNG